MIPPCKWMARCAVGAALAACASAPPTIGGVAGAPPRPETFWTPPAPAAAPAPTTPAPAAPIPTAAALSQLTLSAVVDLALRNNPATRISWSQARAAADLYGASRAPLYPVISGALNAGQSQAASSGGIGVERSQVAPSVTLSQLVLDFGGRGGAIESARQTAIAADFTHNATVQNTILVVETAAFTYLATRALRDAQRAVIAEATANLAAAEERHRVGLATIADVLQARTARAQQALNLETLEGQLQVARGGVATAMGFPVTAQVDMPAVMAPDSTTVRVVSASVDSIIGVAVRNRPDLAAARADGARAAAQLKIARGSVWPSLSVGGSTAYTNSSVSNFTGRSYALSIGLSVPIFAGFSRDYAIAAAAEGVETANARTEAARRQIELQVFTSYTALQTATERVRTSAELLASAEASDSVALGRYTEGVGSIVDLLIAQSALADARAQSVGARWQWRTLLALLAHDAGVLGIHGESLVPLSPNPGGGR